MSGSHPVIAFRQRIKKALVQSFGSQCYCCHNSFPAWVYDFHHLNPKEKSFGLGANGITRSKDAYAKEAQKCIMVCANCHRMIEHGGIELIDAESNFNPSVYYQTIEEEAKASRSYNKKQRDKIKDSNKRENKEGALKREVVYPTREQLKELIRTTSFIKIGKMYGFSDNAVRKWCDKMNLPRTKEDINAYSDEEWALI